MSERKGIEKNISVRTVVVTAIIVSSVLLMAVSFWFTSYLVTALLGVIPVLSFVYAIARHNYEKNLSSTRTGVVVNVCDNRAVITCTLNSSHPKRLFVNKAYLFVDAGKIQGRVYKFEHILRHEYGEVSCLVEKKITAGDITSYQDINPKGEGLFFELRHLSSATILYLDPDEEFSDDCVVELEDGVYRAMFVITFKNADCNCAMKHFIVGGNKKVMGSSTVPAGNAAKPIKTGP
jgi:hypothetical protein